VNPLVWVLLTVVLGDAGWFEVLRVGMIGDVGGECREAVTIISIVVSVSWSLLLASMTHRASRPSLIFCLRSADGAFCTLVLG
jgi:hypothetical protein